MTNTLLQPVALLLMAYGGILTGILYDFFRLPRRLFTSRLIHVLCDVLFVIFSCAVIALSFLLASGGAIRPYLCLGLLAGFFLQQWSLSYLFFHLFYGIRARL